MGRLARGGTALCASVAIAACGSNDAGRGIAVERTDSAGIEIVQSPGTDQPLEWRIEEVGVIDSESTEAGVFEPSSYAIGADDAGRIFALDRSGNRVVVFDADGNFVRSLGGRGGGPGEVQFPLALVVADDGSSAVFDGAKRRFVWFGADGSVMPEGEFSAPFFGGTMRQTDAGLIYDSNRAVEGTPGRSGIAIAGGDSAITVIERDNEPTRPIELASCGMGFSGLPPIFAPQIRWDAHGARVAAAPEADYEIRIFDDGREVRRVRRAVEPRAATPELAARELGEGMRVRTDGGERVCRTDEVVEQRGFAPVVPAIRRIALDPQGGMWVQRAGIADEPQPIDVFAPDGAYLGTLPQDTPFPAAFLPDGRYAAVTVDELDVTRIVIVRVHAPVFRDE
ncbi:MAG TPA: 6-bladed beta-propeller [Longimicrobiales bacterium]|nr:6-bladed beta-propeller [Longimicrobiales bacterium]